MTMKAIVIDSPGGLDKLRIADVEEPRGEIKIRVKYAGLNPIDVNTIKGSTNYKISPYPHIPGAEFVGEVTEINTEHTQLKIGDRVVVYSRYFDGKCGYCASGRQELCDNGGIYGATRNGGYSEFFAAPEQNFIKIPAEMTYEDAVGLPVGGLTSYHALRVAALSPGEKVLVVGASGNTGQYAVLLSKMFGAEVYYISRKKWLDQFGATEWNGEKIDLIVNSLGTEFFGKYLEYLNKGGRIVTFGTYTGKMTQLDLAFLYTGERRIIGSTGGSLQEMRELVSLVNSKKIKTRVWKHFKYTELPEAIKQYEEKDGRIIIDF